MSTLNLAKQALCLKIYMSSKRVRERRVWFGPDWVREKACASGKANKCEHVGVFGANFLFRDNWFRHTLVESGSEAELAG